MLLSRDWARKLNGYIATDFSHMWLPWKGVPNQIKIDSTPRLKLMITEYGEDNEIMFVETDLGSYKPIKQEILMLQSINEGRCLEDTITSTEVLIESNTIDSEGGGTFENFRDFVLNSVKQEIELGKDASIKNLLLPNWCRIHEAFLSEITCAMCKVAIEKVARLVPLTSLPEEHQKMNEEKSVLIEEIVKDDTTQSKVGEKTPEMCNQEETRVQSPNTSTDNQVWTLRFDGSKSKKGNGAGFELVSPTGEAYLGAYRLQFSCTNNVAEYESLIHGLLLAIQKGAKIVYAIGDSDIVVRQVRKQFAYHDKRLNHYRNIVWDLIESFDAFNIKQVYQSKNTVANSLAQAASSLEPLAMEGLKKVYSRVGFNASNP